MVIVTSSLGTCSSEIVSLEWVDLTIQKINKQNKNKTQDDEMGNTCL